MFASKHFVSFNLMVNKSSFKKDSVDTVALGGMLLHVDEHWRCRLFLVNSTYTTLLLEFIGMPNVH